MNEFVRGYTMQVRLSEEEREAFRLAAGVHGVKVSQWARVVLRLASIEQLRLAGVENPLRPSG